MTMAIKKQSDIETYRNTCQDILTSSPPKPTSLPSQHASHKKSKTHDTTMRTRTITQTLPPNP
jgi:hypothetical protein